MNAITKVIDVLGNGSVVECARRLSADFGENITYQAIRKWEEAGCVPAERAIPVAEATNWAVTPHQLNPQIYRYPDDGLPVDRRKAAA